MRIPDGPTGFPTVSATQLRTYGAGGFRLDSQEEAKGCPRQYRAKYVERRVQEDERSYPLVYGSFFHDVLFTMEQEDIGPDEALERCFPADAEPEMWAEARADLTAYLERGASPVDRYGTIAVESELDALLYVDEEFGEVHYRGFIDWLGLDVDDPSTIHVVDYKTNRSPPSVEDVRGDVQLKSYAWLVLNNRQRFGVTTGPLRVVVHLDAVKWREIEVRYTDQEIADWHDWAVAVCRKILRDEDATPVLNPGCGYCPVSGDCPKFQALPATAAGMAAGLAEMVDPEARLRWRDAANGVRLLLEKSVEKIDDEFKVQARLQGEVVVGETVFALEPDWKTVIDLRSLHRAMGDAFYDVVTTSKKKIEERTADWDTGAVAPVKQTIERVPAGSKIVRRKVER